MLPVLIIVNGVPAAGKTTLAAKLARDLQLPRIGKDDVKELLFETIGVGDRAWSQDLGAGVSNMQFAFIDTWIGRGHSLVAESAFYKSFAAPLIAAIIAANKIQFLEIYCSADPAIRRQRFAQRVTSGQRHPGHADQASVDLPTAEIDERYAPLHIGDCLQVDTTSFGEVEYQQLLQTIKARLRSTA